MPPLRTGDILSPSLKALHLEFATEFREEPWLLGDVTRRCSLVVGSYYMWKTIADSPPSDQPVLASPRWRTIELRLCFGAEHVFV